MKRGDVYDIAQATPRRFEYAHKIVERQLHLFGEIGFWRTIRPAANLTRDKQQVSGPDRRRIAVLLGKGMAVERGNFDALLRMKGKFADLVETQLSPQAAATAAE